MIKSNAINIWVLYSANELDDFLASLNLMMAFLDLGFFGEMKSMYMNLILKPAKRRSNDFRRQ